MNKLSLDEKQEFVRRCPRKVYKYKNMTQTVEIEDADRCNLCNECIKYVNEDLDKLKYETAPVIIDEVQNKFIFTVEATGALAPERIVVDALHILKEKLKTLKDY